MTEHDVAPESAGETANLLGTASLAEISDSDGVLTLKLSGEVDLSCVDALRSVVDPIVRRAPGRIVFDLSELQFMDSSGLALLVGVARRVGTLELQQPTPMVRRIIELTGLTEVLRVID